MNSKISDQELEYIYKHNSVPAIRMMALELIQYRLNDPAYQKEKSRQKLDTEMSNDAPWKYE